MAPHRLLPAAILVLVQAATAGAVPPPSFAEAWRWTHFTTSAGLPSNYVSRAIEVPGDGLWAVTRNGFVRFDGFLWRTVPLPDEAPRTAESLATDGLGQVVVVSNDGRLLVGTSRGLDQRAVSADGRALRFRSVARARSGPVLLLEAADRVIYEWDGHTCRRHEPSRHLSGIRMMVGAGPAGVWISDPAGLASWNGERWIRRLDGRGAALNLLAAAERGDSSAFAYLDNPLEWRGLWEWDASGRARPVQRAVGSPIVALVPSATSDLLVVHETGELMWRHAEGWTPFASGSVTIADARAAGFTADGLLWVATDLGMYVHRTTSRRWRTLAYPPPDEANTINDIVRTGNGEILLATGRGLGRIDRNGRLQVTRDPQDDIGSLTGLAVDARGRIWATSGYAMRGVRWRDRTGWHPLTGDRLLDATLVHKVAMDRDGGVWFLGLSALTEPTDPTTREGPGAFRLAPDGRIARWGRPEGLPSGRVYAFSHAPDGAYWFATSAGLSRWHDGRWRHWNRSNGLALDRVFTVAVDRGGVAWFSHQSRHGLGRLEGESIRYTTMSEGLATDIVWLVYIDEAGRLWASGEGGVAFRQDGRWAAFDHRHGLTRTRIWPVLQVGDDIYLGTRGGGVAVLSLADDRTQPPLVLAEALVDANRAVVRWHPFSWWGEVPPEAIHTRIRFDDGPWSAWSTAREAEQNQLPPGRHRITIQSKGLLGTIDPVAARAEFVVEPPLLRRPAFYLPVGSLLLIAIGLAAVLAVRQRRHYRELEVRERQFTRTFQASPVAASITTLGEGRFLDVNAAFVALSGRPREEVIGRTVHDTGLVDDTYDRRATTEALEAGPPPHGVALRACRHTGEVLDLLAYFELIEFAGQRAILGQYLDMTERHRLEAQLRQAQKMESIGRLAGGVAHDFNNLLTVIIGNAALVDSELPREHAVRTEMEQIRIAAERAERLTHQLLAFARKQVVEPRVVNVNDIVTRTSGMLRRLIGEDVELVTLPTPELPQVLIDPYQLEQVLLNMAVNARDAMPSGGTLTIRTGMATLSEREARQHPEANAGTHVRISVADTGVGMDADTVARVFEPFFTTKGPGKGTGLGLATCYGLIKQAGGHILVQSAPGQGTTFHVDLPAALESPAAPVHADTRADAAGGAETILLVEDEAQVRKLAAQVLRNRGYHVLEAATGPEALGLTGQHPGRIDILVTDIVMPQMRGTELAQRIRALRPSVRILYVSGYVNDDALRQEVGAEQAAFLPKPFTPTSLAQAVRELLDTPR